MDIELFAEHQKTMPVFNQEIVEGLAYSGLKRAKADVDHLIECAAKSFPPGFEFIGSRVCHWQEAYRIMANPPKRSDRHKPSIDLAPSNVYLVEYNFALNGKKLYPRYFYLPYFRPGGLITIVGKQFSASPVLIDPCFSVYPDSVFIRFNRAPVTFRRVIATFFEDGDDVSRYIPYSWLHNKGGGANSKVVSTLPHYLFCRYGVVDTFRRFAFCSVGLVHQDQLRSDPDRYPEKDFVRLTGETSPMVLLVPRNHHNELTLRLAGGFFYILDRYADVTDADDLLDCRQWKIWMGDVLKWGDQLGHSKLVENVDTHLNSLDDYADIEARNNLKNEEGLDIENIYELFAYIIVEMDTLISTKEVDIASMYGKRMSTAPYILRDVFEKIFLCLFEFTNNRKRQYTENDFNKTLGRYFTPTTIMDLRKVSEKPFIQSVSTPGDNMLVKITARVVQQAQTSAMKKGNVNVSDPMSKLHASSAEAGNYGVLIKSSPLARNMANPTVLLDENKTIMRKPHMKPLIEYIDSVIGHY